MRSSSESSADALEAARQSEWWEGWVVVVVLLFC